LASQSRSARLVFSLQKQQRNKILLAMKISLPQLAFELEHTGKKRIFDLLLENKIPIASSCRGNGICHWCKISIEPQDAKLSKKSKFELAAKLEENERLSCQCKAKEDLIIRTSYW
jgi:2Fe-2S ferredoxin